jgi:hypothetical protein
MLVAPGEAVYPPESFRGFKGTRIVAYSGSVDSILTKNSPL